MEKSYEKDLPWIDTHTHLHVKRFNRERENILQWMQDTGMRNIEIPIEYDSNFRMREKLAGFENARFVVGVHPTRVSKITAKDARKQLETLKKKRRQFKGVVHCFQGDIELANQYMELGFYLGIGGSVTYTGRCSALRKAMVDIPIERIVLETDCPYLTPEPLEGYNTPKNLSLIAEMIVELKDLDVGKVKAETAKNAQTLFGVW